MPTVYSIPLKARDGSTRAYALVDPEDYDALMQWPWHLSRDGYAARSLKPTGTQKMHRQILGLSQGDKTLVDHVDRDRLNNRRANLRVVTALENAQNRGVSPRNQSSRHRGVTWNGYAWVAQAGSDGAVSYLGSYATEEDAAAAAAQWRAAHMPGSIEDPNLLARIVTVKRNGRSQYRGVHYFKRLKTKPWTASLMVNRKAIHLGYFEDEESAARAYDTKAREILGSRARLNFLSEGEDG